MFAVSELRVRGGFVADFETLEMHDADESFAAFPDLALLKFHRKDPVIQHMGQPAEILIKHSIADAPDQTQSRRKILLPKCEGLQPSLKVLHMSRRFKCKRSYQPSKVKNCSKR